MSLLIHMNKLSIFTYLGIFILIFNSLLPVSALPDGDYFSDDINVTNQYEWEVENFYLDPEWENATTIFDEGSILTIDILLDPAGIKVDDPSINWFDYFLLAYDGVQTNDSEGLFIFIKPSIRVVGGIASNLFELDEEYIIYGDNATYQEELGTTDSLSILEYTYNKNTGILQYYSVELYMEGELTADVKIVLNSSIVVGSYDRYFSDSIKAGDSFEWEVTYYYVHPDMDEAYSNESEVGSTMQLNVLSNVTGLKVDEPINWNDYFKVTYDGEEDDTAVDSYVLMYIYPSKCIIDGIVENTFEIEDEFTISGQNASRTTEEYQLGFRVIIDQVYDKDTGILQEMTQKMYLEGELMIEGRIELITSTDEDEGPLGFDSSTLLFATPVLIMLTLLKKRNK